jgi:hypothetical protein
MRWLAGAGAELSKPAQTSVVLAATATAVFRTADTGATAWTQVLALADTAEASWSSSASDVVYVAARLYGVHRSTNAGANWSVANTGIEGLDVLTVSASQTSVLSAIAGTAGQGAYRTTDGGAFWSAASTGLPLGDVKAVRVDPLDDTIVYAVIGDGYLYKSLSGGQ